MKKLLLIFTLAVLTSCSIGIKQIGDLNMISKRNVDLNTEYTQLKTYAGSSTDKELKKEFKKVKSTTIDEAVDYTVKNTPGGEFLTNVKIYSLNSQYFIVRGDVWGKASNEIDYKGWKVGDQVEFKKAFKKHQGEIVNLKSAEEVTIKTDEGKIINISYDKLTKIGSN